MMAWGLSSRPWTSNTDSQERDHLLALLSAHLEALSKQYNFTL